MILFLSSHLLHSLFFSLSLHIRRDADQPLGHTAAGSPPPPPFPLRLVHFALFIAEWPQPFLSLLENKTINNPQQ